MIALYVSMICENDTSDFFLLLAFFIDDETDYHHYCQDQ